MVVKVETEEKRAVRLARAEEHRHYDFTMIWARRYAEMKARVEGRSTNHSCSQGKELLSREDFSIWCKTNPHFIMFVVIYLDWVRSDFNLMLAPSIDRVDPDLGYTSDNMQWLTFIENCEKNHKDPMDYLGGYWGC